MRTQANELNTTINKMKTIIYLLVVTIIIFTLASAAWAQFSINWYKVAGGGGTSTNGQYSLGATIGQPDASIPMSGGNYSVAGGYWSLVNVVQTAGAPLLTVTHVGTNVIVSWPYPSTGCVLQQNNNLNTTNWVNSVFTIATNASINSITMPSPTGRLFFRLKQ